MSIDKEPVGFKMHFRVFDCADESIRNEPFDYRLMHAERLLKEYQTELTLPKFAATSIIEHKLVYTLEDLLAYESLCLAAGYEGIMLRDPKGRYKHGRATVNEGLIYKLKRFQDAEAVVTGLEEAQRNENVLETDAQGYAKRSTAKAGLIGSDTLGRLIVDYDGQELKLSPGALKHDERQRIWDNPNEYLGKIAKFRFFAHGVKDKPRFPRFVGWRSKTDM
jgi:DNA ligase-1